ncbi:MAG: hypothetical protein RJA98_1532 [Pseudomonadota bacterium]|jgi:diguanylate cyclase (GGDEF)-like protein/PAS domain S-box-containing protein
MKPLNPPGGTSPALVGVALPEVLDGISTALCLVHPVHLMVVAANGAALALLGRNERDCLGLRITELCTTPHDLAFWHEVSLGMDDRITADTLLPQPGGAAPVPVTLRVWPLPAQGLLAVEWVDCRALRRVERALDEQVAELQATLESTADGILVTDLHGHIRNFNRRFAEMWRLPPELSGQRDDDAVRAWLRAQVADADAHDRRLALLDGAPLVKCSDTVALRDGRVFECVTLPQSSHGLPVGRVASFRDISERLEASRRIDTLALTDALTALPNRQALAHRVDFLLALAAREGDPFALMFLNIDHFKHINDTLGHAFGDRVLREVAERLKGSLRQVDTVARLGGDEFVVLVHQADHAGAEASARRLLDAMQAPFLHGGLSFTVTCSIGIALHPLDGHTLDELLTRADAAMSSVKEAGRASFRFHQARFDAEAVDGRSRLRLDHAMRLALPAHHFQLHYQPQVDMRTGAVGSVEALIRWHDPVLGDVSPGEFIPVAEESGFIVAIGAWVLREAVRQAAEWQRTGLPLVVSVNVSALQFQQEGFVDSVATALRQAELAPEWLELELTESILVQDVNQALQRLNMLARLGVKLAIDDFGTGYSSLAYLKRFPIDRLKIDRSFVNGLPTDESDVGIASAIVNMARALRLEVVAEGVETAAQAQFLREAGCDQYQGFLYSRALPAAELRARLSAP